MPDQESSFYLISLNILITCLLKNVKDIVGRSFKLITSGRCPLSGGSAISYIDSSINVHILYTLFYIFPMVLKGEYFKQSTTSLVGNNFLHFHVFNV